MSTGKIQKLISAIAQLDRTNKEQFTGNGEPKVDVLAEAIKDDVSAAERDEAWKIYLVQQEAAEKKAAKTVDLTGANFVVTMINGRPQKVWYRDGKRIHIGEDPNK